MRNVLVAGGTGGVGEGIVRALLACPDVRVAVSSRSDERCAALRRRLAQSDLARLTTFVGDCSDVPTALASAERVAAEFGQLDAIVPSLGGWWAGGPLLEVDDATWRAVMDEMLTSHFLFARAFIPHLVRKPGGLYLGIGGGAALSAIAGSSIVSVAAAGQIMLTRALQKELAGVDVAIMELVVNGPVSTGDAAAIARPDWITADDVGSVVAELVETRTSTRPNCTFNGPLIVISPLPYRTPQHPLPLQ